MNTDNHHHVTSACTDLIVSAEKERLVAYLCPSNRLTIGIGHVLLPKFDCGLWRGLSADNLKRIIDECQKRRKVTQESQLVLRINREQSTALLLRDVRQTALFVRSVTPVKLTQHQFDALVSFVFNIGQGAYALSTLRKKLNTGDYAAAAAEFDRWVMGTVNGQKQQLPGLVTRRAAERALFEQIPLDPPFSKGEVTQPFI
jgi:lysozyme